jgi:hypothetical protein
MLQYALSIHGHNPSMISPAWLFLKTEPLIGPDNLQFVAFSGPTVPSIRYLVPSRFPNEDIQSHIKPGQLCGRVPCQKFKLRRVALLDPLEDLLDSNSTKPDRVLE